MVDLLVGIVTFRVKHLQYERLHFFEILRIAAERRKVVRYVRHFDLLGEQIRFVEKENNGHVPKALVVYDCLEDVDALGEPIRRPIFHENLIVAARRDEKDDRRHFVEALEPFRSLRSLPADVDHFEWNALDGEVVLEDAARRLARAKHVLFSR